jgi:hypothetical protein
MTAMALGYWLRWGVKDYLPGLASKHNPLIVRLLDYKHEPPGLAEPFFKSEPTSPGELSLV